MLQEQNILHVRSREKTPFVRRGEEIRRVGSLESGETLFLVAMASEGHEGRKGGPRPEGATFSEALSVSGCGTGPIKTMRRGQGITSLGTILK